MKESSIIGTVLLTLLAFFIFAVAGLFILPPRDISLKDIPPAIIPPTMPKEVTSRDTMLIGRPKTDGDYKEQVEYYIIVESFRNLTLAQQEAEKLKNDFNTNIIVLPPTTEGFYRISYGKYLTPEEAKSAINYIRTNISSDAWIFSTKN
jgi:hypothetical protein